MIDPKFKLTEEQKTFFGDRLTESASGRVSAPAHLYKKFRKITDNEFLSNEEIKTYLITKCYLY